MWHLILTHLSQADLYNICLAHRRLRVVAETYLYSKIHFGWKESQPHPITSLLRSMLRRPQLATYVRQIMLVGDSFYLPHYKARTPKIPVSESELEEALAFVARTKVSYRKIWSEALQTGTMDAFVAILLSQPLHLTNLYVGYDFSKESQFLGLVLQSMICETLDCGLRLDLRYLESVSLKLYFENPQYRHRRKIADVLLLFYLPSVKRISASINNLATFSWPLTHQPSLPNLRSLELDTIREPNLSQLLMVADQLQSFKWEWYYDPDLNDHAFTPIIDLPRITAAISHVQNTLSELVLKGASSVGRDVELPELTIHGSLKAIAGFYKLRRFTVPLVFLLGFSPDSTMRIEDFLPPSLEFLTITDNLCFHNQYEWTDRETLSVLEIWLEGFQASTPYLCEVAFFLRQTDSNWNQPIRDEFYELCVRVGIRGKVTKLLQDLYDE